MGSPMALLPKVSPRRAEEVSMGLSSSPAPRRPCSRKGTHGRVAAGPGTCMGSKVSLANTMSDTSRGGVDRLDA